MVSRTCSLETDVQDFNQHATVHTSLAQERSPTNCDNTARAGPSSHVLESPSEGDPIQSRAITKRLGSPEAIQELENETVDFGRKNCGRSYQEIWNTDQEWVTFMVDRYGKSHNLSHRKFLKYVELMVQHHKENQMPMVVHQGQGYVGGSGHADGPPSTRMMAKPKAKAKMGAATNTGLAA